MNACICAGQYSTLPTTVSKDSQCRVVETVLGRALLAQVQETGSCVIGECWGVNAVVWLAWGTVVQQQVQQR
jgi:hypothetical protein